MKRIDGLADRAGSAPRTQIIHVTGMGSELQGVGKQPDGRVIFIPGALPGETVEIEVLRESKRFCEARLTRVLEASPDRIPPECPHAERCGGCAARHMRYEATLAQKQQRVADALSRIGGIPSPTVRETLGCAQPERCRNKAEYAVEATKEGVRAGCVEKRSHRVLPIGDCLLQKPQSVRALNWLAAHLAEYPFAPHIRALVTRVNRAGVLSAVLCGDTPCFGERGFRESGAGGFSPRGSASVPTSKGGARAPIDLRGIADAMSAALPELLSLHYCHLNPRPAHALDGICTRILGADAMTDTLLGLRFELSPQAFFQVNPEQAEALYRIALDAAGISAARASGNPSLGSDPGEALDAHGCESARTERNWEARASVNSSPGSDPVDALDARGCEEDRVAHGCHARAGSPRVLDVYCGAGTITLAAAAQGATCVGVELVEPAIENARRNAERNGLGERASFLCGDATREIPRLISRGERFDAAILDPPRKGADAAVLNALADAHIPRIAYVSCDPATLARDIKLLTERGYALRWAQPVDMFPWTGHVETVALMTRVDR